MQEPEQLALFGFMEEPFSIRREGILRFMIDYIVSYAGTVREQCFQVMPTILHPSSAGLRGTSTTPFSAQSRLSVPDTLPDPNTLPL